MMLKQRCWFQIRQIVFFQISVQKFQNKAIFVSIFLFSFSNSIKLCISAKTKVLISNLTIAFSSYSLKGPKAILFLNFFFNMKFRILTKLTMLISNMTLVFFSNYCLEVHKYGILGSILKDFSCFTWNLIFDKLEGANYKNDNSFFKFSQEFTQESIF